MTVGQHIRQARELANMTQAELGEKIGVSGVAIMRYEKGTRQPRLEQLQRIADELGVGVSYLLSGGDASSQTHLENGIHIYKDTSPFRVVEYFLNDFPEDTSNIVYQDEYLLIAVDKNSSATKKDVERIVKACTPYRRRLRLKLKEWKSNKAGRLYMSIDSDLLDLLEQISKEDGLSLEDEIEKILHEDVENRLDENMTEDVTGLK